MTYVIIIIYQSIFFSYVAEISFHTFFQSMKEVNNILATEVLSPLQSLVQLKETLKKIAY